MTENEAILLKRFSTGADAEAFAELTRRYVQMVYSTSWRVLKDDNDATDVTQETFFELTRHAGRITGSLGAWLHRVATQKSIDVIRRSVHRRQRERAYARNKPVEVQTWQDMSEHVDLALEKLDASSRELLMDHFIDGKTTAKIAQERGVSQATISRRINAGLERLRGILKRKGLLVTAAALATMLMENTSQAVSGAVMGGLGKMAMVGTTSGATAVAGKIATIKAALAAAAVVGTLSVAGYVHHRCSVPPLPPLSAHAQMQAIAAASDGLSVRLDDEGTTGEPTQAGQATVTDGFSSMAETPSAQANDEPSDAAPTVVEATPAGTIRGPVPEYPALDRVLRFSPDRSIGVVYAQDAQAAVSGRVPGFDSGSGIARWERLGGALGEVRVSAQKRPILSVRGLHVTPECYLQAMNSFGPDDLYELQFFAMHPIHIRDDLIQPITALTGLRKLDLATIAVTPHALSYVGQLPYVQELSTPWGLSDHGMAEIAGLSFLKRLNVGSNAMTDAGLQSLGQLKSLEVLDLTGNSDMTDEGVKALAQLPALKHLRLRGSFKDRAMVHLAALPSLKTLWLDSSSLTDEGLRHLAQSRSLERLGGRWLGNVTGRGLASLRSMSQLRQVDLEHASLTDADLAHLAALPQLSELHLPGALTDAGIGHLAHLDHLKTLRTNSYVASALTDESLTMLSGMRSLETLEIGGSGFTEAGIEALVNLENLEVLVLRSSGGDGVDDDSLKRLAQLPKLRDLSVMSNGNVTMSGVNALNALCTLERLSIAGVRQDDGGLDLSSLVQLKRLSISMWRPTRPMRPGRPSVGEAFGDRDLASLSALTDLEELRLSGAGIGDDDLAHLAGLTHLTLLSLDGGRALTDIGLERLAHLPRLKRLNIYDSQITEQGLACLSPLKTLHNVCIQSSVPIDGQAIGRLQGELPYLQTFHVFSRPQVQKVATVKPKTRRLRPSRLKPTYTPSRPRRRR